MHCTKKYQHCLKFRPTHSIQKNLYMIINENLHHFKWWGNIPRFPSGSKIQFITDVNSYTVKHINRNHNHPNELISSYAPELARCDFWRFPKLIKPLRAQRFKATGDVQCEILLAVKTVPEKSTVVQWNYVKGSKLNCSKKNSSFYTVLSKIPCIQAKASRITSSKT